MEFNNITQLLEKYFEGESSIAEEKELKAYFNSHEVQEEHKEYKPLFGFFTEAQQIELPGELDLEGNIDFLLELYFEGETSIDQERKLKAYFNTDDVDDRHQQFAGLFGYFSTAQTEKLEKDLEIKLQKKTNVTKLRIMRNRFIGIAASLAIILSSIFIMNNYMNKQATIEMATVDDPEAALEATMDALAYLGVQFNKGTESMEQIKTLSRTQILKN
jgi:hypothetical protein